MRNRTLQYWALRGFLLAAALAFLLPFYLMFSTALKTPSEAIDVPPTLFPHHPTLSAFRDTIDDPLFLRYFANGIIVSCAVAFGVTIVSLVAAYAFSIVRFRGRDVLFILVLATMMIPFEVLVIPSYVVVQRLGWFDTYPALIVPLLAHPFSVFVLRQMMLQVPRELLDASKVDGAGHLRTMAQVVTPLVVPGVVVVAFLAFVRTWGDLLWPLLITSSSEMRTPQVGLFAYSQQVGALPLAMAGATIVVLPTVLAFLLMQRHLIATLASVGLK